MNDQDKLVVKRDDLNVMINAIENMLRSLNLLGSSLAGMIPEQILPAQLPLIAENLISYCFPGIPYNIYAKSAEAYSAEREAAIRRFLLFFPAIPSIIAKSLEPDFIELRIEEETATDDTILELGFSETAIDSEKKKIDELWQKLPEGIRKEFTYRFLTSENRNSLAILPAKN